MNYEQENINALCKVAHDISNDLVMNSTAHYTEKLRTCRAIVYAFSTKVGEVYLLRSYNTIIAYIDESGNKYDFLRLVYGYTSTSAQHIRKFFEDYGNKNRPTYTYKFR